MDSVRFGRVLGIGARLAAKTMVSAVDAATAPNPSAAKAKQDAGGDPAAGSSSTTTDKAKASGTRLGQNATRTTAQVRQTTQGLKEGSRRFRKAAWGPLAKASGALWLELTGVFFGIFAVFAGGGVWLLLHQQFREGESQKPGTLVVGGSGYTCASCLSQKEPVRLKKPSQQKPVLEPTRSRQKPAPEFQWR